MLRSRGAWGEENAVGEVEAAGSNERARGRELVGVLGELGRCVPARSHARGRRVRRGAGARVPRWEMATRKLEAGFPGRAANPPGK
jgi:hypothetical protein